MIPPLQGSIRSFDISWGVAPGYDGSAPLGRNPMAAKNQRFLLKMIAVGAIGHRQPKPPFLPPDLAGQGVRR